jgi:hypothetical protein
MAGTAFIHINGENYEYGYPIDNAQSQQFQDLERKVQRLASGAGSVQRFDVILKGTPTTLCATSQGVFAAAVFFEEGKSPNAF